MTTKLEKRRNPILEPQKVQEARLESLVSPVTFRRPLDTAKRTLRDLRHRETARAALAGLDKSIEIFGFTKGQFSLLDLIVEILAVTGPASMVLSTWTAARHEIEALAKLREAGTLLSARWLIDFSFARRDPAAANHIRKTFGVDSCRVAQNHAKFSLFENDQWRIVLRTSMNLNMNPRFEDFQIAHDPALADFLRVILDEIWTKQARSMMDETPYEIVKHFQTEM